MQRADFYHGCTPLHTDKNGFKPVGFGFEMGLNWLYLALNGFVFYHQNHHLPPVKSVDSCIFKMALFRNFHISR